MEPRSSAALGRNVHDSSPKNREILMTIYHRLLRHFGPRGWWPGETPFEVCIGAILVQNTSWTNASLAIRNLKKNRLLSPEKLHEVSRARLARLIRPARFFNLKSERLKSFVKFLWNKHGGDLNRLFELPDDELRETLVQLKGIGPETADSISLYAAERSVFVVDAYTRRIFGRLGLYKGSAMSRGGYQSLQDFFHRRLPSNAGLFNEYHALLVELGKEFCRPKPICLPCPLRTMCPYSGEKGECPTPPRAPLASNATAIEEKERD